MTAEQVSVYSACRMAFGDLPDVRLSTRRQGTPLLSRFHGTEVHALIDSGYVLRGYADDRMIREEGADGFAAELRRNFERWTGR